MLFARLLVDSDDLRGARGVQGLDLVGGFDALAADDEVILAAKLAAHSLDGGAHLAGVLFVAKIEEGLVDEWALMGGCCARPDGGFGDCHGGILSEIAGLLHNILHRPRVYSREAAQEVVGQFEKGGCVRTEIPHPAGENAGLRDDA